MYFIYRKICCLKIPNTPFYVFVCRQIYFYVTFILYKLPETTCTENHRAVNCFPEEFSEYWRILETSKLSKSRKKKSRNIIPQKGVFACCLRVLTHFCGIIFGEFFLKDIEMSRECATIVCILPGTSQRLIFRTWS